MDQNSFIIGIDIGVYTSAIARYNIHTGAPEIIDVSGGYGKPSCPTAAVYIPQTDEWVFGEYAVLSGAQGVITDLVRKTYEKASINAGNQTYRASYVLGLFIKDLIKNCEALDPNAQIEGIAVCVPDFFDEKARDELEYAFISAGYDNIPLIFTYSAAGIYNYISKIADYEITRCIILDYGQQALRGGVYDIENTGSDTVILKQSAYKQDPAVSGAAMDSAVYEYITGIYEKNTHTQAADDPALWAFCRQNKESLFRKLTGNKMKLYFGFCSPPFAYTVSNEETEELLSPFFNGPGLFLDELIKKTGKDPVNTIILAGGGFEIQRARELIRKRFPLAKIFDKDTKQLNAKSAALVAAGHLGLVKIPQVIIEQAQEQAFAEYGIMAAGQGGEVFIPLIDKENQKTCRVLINREHAGTLPVYLYKRDTNGDISRFAEPELKNLPIRPKNAMFMDITMRITENGAIGVKVTDGGFGEFFEKTDYTAEFEIIINEP